MALPGPRLVTTHHSLPHPGPLWNLQNQHAAMNVELPPNRPLQFSRSSQEVAGIARLRTRWERHRKAAGGDTVKAPSTLITFSVCQAPCSRKPTFSHKAATRHPAYDCRTLWIPSGCFSSPPSPGRQTTADPSYTFIFQRRHEDFLI